MNPLPVASKFPDSLDPLPVTPNFTDNLEPTPVAAKFLDNLDTHSVDPDFTVETDSLRDLATSGYILNMAPIELHSAVLTPAALGSPFYDISSQLSLNLPTQDLGFTPVQSLYKPFSFPSSLYNPLLFLEEMDTIPFKRQEPPPITLVRAMAFKELMDQGNEVFTLSYMPVSPSEGTTQLRAVGNDPAPTTALYAEPLPMDKGELITKVPRIPQLL